MLAVALAQVGRGEEHGEEAERAARAGAGSRRAGRAARRRRARRRSPGARAARRSPRDASRRRRRRWRPPRSPGPRSPPATATATARDGAPANEPGQRRAERGQRDQNDERQGQHAEPPARLASAWFKAAAARRARLLHLRAHRLSQVRPAAAAPRAAATVGAGLPREPVGQDVERDVMGGRREADEVAVLDERRPSPGARRGPPRRRARSVSGRAATTAPRWLSGTSSALDRLQARRRDRRPRATRQPAASSPRSGLPMPTTVTRPRSRAASVSSRLIPPAPASAGS